LTTTSSCDLSSHGFWYAVRLQLTELRDNFTYSQSSVVNHSTHTIENYPDKQQQTECFVYWRSGGDWILLYQMTRNEQLISEMPKRANVKLQNDKTRH